MTTKTLVIWSDVPEKIAQFFIVNEDWSRFHNIYINLDYKDERGKLAEELNSLIYDLEGKSKFNFSTTPPDKSQFDIIIACGFIL